MKQKDLEKLFDKCLTKWGLTSQILMLAEECSELSTATLHLLRTKKKRAIDSFAEEIADVELMIEEIKYYYSLMNSDLVYSIAYYRTKKEERLKELLKCP